MIRPFALAALILAAAPALAQTAESGKTPERVRSVTLTGEQKCPESTDEEVVVCNRINPDEQYRVPKELRNDHPIPAQNQSWVNRAATADEIGRVAGGLPDTCSPVGTGGQTGCALARARAYAAEKRAARREQEAVPGGEQ